MPVHGNCNLSSLVHESTEEITLLCGRIQSQDWTGGLDWTGLDSQEPSIALVYVRVCL